MNRKEITKHKKKKSNKLKILFWGILVSFVAVLVLFLFSLGGKGIGEILNMRDYWLSIGVANGLILIGFLMMYRVDAQNIALNENDLEDTEWLSVKRLKKLKEFQVYDYKSAEEKTDGIVIGAEKKGGSVEVITTSQLHALIVGTTGSGKTTGFVDQNIAVLGKSKGKPSIVISDPKNGMIIGKSGSGKSFFLKSLIANEWANDTRVIILDPEAEYLTLTKNLSGNLIDVGNAKEGRINPFHIYKILTEDGLPADPVVTFNTHLKMLESFFKIVFVGANSDVIELINNLAVEAYARKGIYETTDCTRLNAEDFPLFTDLLAVLREKNKEETDGLTLRDMRTAELYLQKFVSGRYSDIWNAPSTLKVNADLIDFNFQSLFANKNNTVANAQMLLVFRFIEQEVINAREANKSGKNLRTLIIADEAHLFIDAKFPIALDFFFSMSKRIRKYNGSFIPATQNIADWNANEELRSKTSAILKNSQYTFIFKLSAPDMKDVLDVYKAGDSFNADEQRMIISAVTGQVFFIGSTELRTNVKITTGEYIKSLFEDKTGENYNKEGS